MAYGRSHFYPAIELILVLIVALNFSAPSDMYNATWMLWLIALSLLFVPFLYNPNALQLAALRSDVIQLREWLSTSGVGNDPRVTWRVWWEATTPLPNAHGTATLVGQALMATVYAYLAGGLLVYSNTSLDDGVRGAFRERSLWQLSLSASIVAPALVLAGFDSFASRKLSQLRTLLMILLLLGGLGWFVWVTQTHRLISKEVEHAGYWAGGLTATFYAIPTMLMHTITCSFGLAGICASLTIIQGHIKPARDALRWLHRTRDYLHWCLTLPSIIILLILPHYPRTPVPIKRLLLLRQQRGRSWCIGSFSICCTLSLIWTGYCVLWLLGYINAPPFGWFAC